MTRPNPLQSWPLQSWLLAAERWARPALAVYLAMLLLATHSPQQVVSSSGPIELDKVIHFLAYGVLAGLLAMSLPRAGFWRVVGLVALIGVVDELTQPHFNRVCDPFDLLADTLGAAAGYAAWNWLRRFALSARAATNDLPAE